jgi:hypothetical protein
MRVLAKPASEWHASPSVCVLLLFTHSEAKSGLDFLVFFHQYQVSIHEINILLTVFCCVLSFVVYTTQQAIAKQHLSLSLFLSLSFSKQQKPLSLDSE